MQTPSTTSQQRIPEGEDLALLLRCYSYRLKRSGAATRDAIPPAPEEIAEAERRGWMPKRKLRFTEAEFLQRLTAATDRLDTPSVMAAFVAGVGGSAVRGRQLPMSYAWASGVTRAIAAGGVTLADFDVRQPIEIDYSLELLSLALGGAWNERPVRFLPDLEAAAEQGLPSPGKADWQIFHALIETIAAQPPGTTPGQLEKVLATQKLLPKTDKYQRYGILQALAELGVMPNPYLPPSFDRAILATERHTAGRQVPGGSRSDIVLPLSGWRAELGIDRSRLEKLFGSISIGTV